MEKLEELDLTEFEGLNTYNAGGYITYYIPEHHLANKSGKVYQHMIAAEQMLGRELNKGEVVHHKDRNKHNNSFDNLIVFKTVADHTAFHMGREIVLDGDVYVALDKYKYKKYVNGKTFYCNRYDECPYCGGVKNYSAEMCLDCYKKQQAKNIPPKEEIYELLRDNSMCAIGRVYGVSDNAVRKWCKKYNLPFRKKDIDKFREEEFGIVKRVKVKQSPTPSKPVCMYDKNTYELIKTFDSLCDAGKYLGDIKKRNHIAQVCNGKRESAYGYWWEFA